MNKLVNIKNIVDCIIYHHPCQDGQSAAWVIKKSNPYAILVPKSINNNLIDEALYIDKNVIMVDIVTNDFMTIKTKAKNLVILDHHKTNQEKLKDIDYAYFDMNKSGVGLAWEYIHGDDDQDWQCIIRDNQLPKFLACIQDRDLWSWKIPDARDFCDGFKNIMDLEEDDRDFKLFDELYEEHLDGIYNTKFNSYCVIGNILNKIKMSKIKYMASNKTLYQVKIPNNNSLRVAFFNCSHDLCSDLGNYVITNTDADFVVMWRYVHDKDEYHYSLRSCDAKTDVSAICELFGGGGHRNASGCASKLHPKELFQYEKVDDTS